MRHRLQVFCAAARLAVHDHLSQPLWPFLLTMTPFTFALVGAFLYQDQPPETFALYVVLGSGAMGMWSTALGGAGYSVLNERMWGTSQYIFTTPASPLWIAAGKSIVHVATGLLLLLEILLITILFFDMQLVIASLWAFSLATLLTILAFSAIGLLLNSFFMLTRQAGYWYNALTRFLYVFCGLMYPISVLPGWLRPVSYILAPTWSLEAIRLSVQPGALRSPDYLIDLGLALLLVIVYILLAWYVQGMVDRRLRLTAELERM